MSSTSASFNFSFNWTLSNFKSCPDEFVRSPTFTAIAPFNGIAWRLWVYPNGVDSGSKGYVSLVLELVKSESSKRLKKLDTLVVNYKLGILNRTNKLIDFVQDEDDFASKVYGKAKFFLRCRLLADAENIFKYHDSITFRAEVIYSEHLLQQILPATDCSDFEQLLEKRAFADIVIKVIGDDLNEMGSLSAHRAILAARSSVFEAMLTRDMVERRTNEIEINDLEFEVVKEMVSYIYTGFVNNMADYAVDLLFAADKYDLRSLGDLCVKYLIGHVNEKNVVDLLLASYLSTLR